jgi:hypothetical protein
MKIRSHSESHLVELEDGTQWRIFPGDIDVTLGWAPETDLTPLKVDDEIGSPCAGKRDRPRSRHPVGESWPEREVKSILKDG